MFSLSAVKIYTFQPFPFHDVNHFNGLILPTFGSLFMIGKNDLLRQVTFYSKSREKVLRIEGGHKSNIETHGDRTGV